MDTATASRLISLTTMWQFASKKNIREATEPDKYGLPCCIAGKTVSNAGESEIQY